MTPTAVRVIYPELPDPLTPGDLQQLFSPSFDERKWAPTVTRTPEAQMALLVQLKIFQTIGRFLPVVDVPLVAIKHVARRMGVGSGSNLFCPDRTLYRHRQAILKRLEVDSWGTRARALAHATMQSTAQARTDPADIINSAIDALIRMASSCRLLLRCAGSPAPCTAKLTPRNGPGCVGASLQRNRQY